ncbi:autotransporter domain-containing protein [Ancylobacter sp. FA202]|uniref:autotransporter domain-containing protein n=1 Tax=Ancylobacter sp. FA202 TaxID=1111106 RepID=UPI0003803971|nr:autotransporter domain-containing protein [Ancylobacter sp. FA202]
MLFNTLTDGELGSLYGGIEGDASSAQMLLGTYDSSAVFTGDITVTSLVRPYAQTVAATGTTAAVGAARTLYAVAGTTNGLFGAMAPVTLTLNELEGPALSGAISQTLPVLAGAATEATANVQRMLGQVVTERLDAPDRSDSSTRAWVRPLGGGGQQGAIGGVPGYSFGGGAAFGVDRSFDGQGRAGALFAFTSTSVTADTDAARANLASGSANLRSYLLGAYGSTALAGGRNLAVEGQTTRKLFVSGELALRHALTEIPGADLSPWLFTAGVGLVAAGSDTLSFDTPYDVEASPSAYLNQTGSVAVTWRL